MAQEQVTARGACLCGAVRYEVRGPLRAVFTCHCDECRAFTGSVWQATAARKERVSVEGVEYLAWYQSSPRARRGFCRECGSSLFMEPTDGRPYVAIAAGTLEKPTGLERAVHIWTAEAGDYYPIDDAIPRHADGEHGLPQPE